MARSSDQPTRARIPRRLVLLVLGLVEEALVDEGDHTTAGDGCEREERGEEGGRQEGEME